MEFPLQLAHVPVPLTHLSFIRFVNIGRIHFQNAKLYISAWGSSGASSSNGPSRPDFDLFAGATSKLAASHSHLHPRIRFRRHFGILPLVQAHLHLPNLVHLPVLLVVVTFSQTAQIKDSHFLTNLRPLFNC
jgi:hypothetical protein